ncbi:hypothetical protein GCM10022233_69510 [Streptomyces shaanxiensis]|uniref:Orc1-like AAA ATPase domain-containing protein n=1 Tax=Streptomyces shaanxiensis TaxID=653357 RepID=A0ABP7W482_9ACTN
MAQTPSMQELIRRRRQAGFVGRQSELGGFRGNFAAAEEQRRFLFCIYGDAGVGKTLLMEQFQRVAREEAGALTARADETSDSLADTLESLVGQLAPKGTSKAFDKALAAHRQQLREAQNVPDLAAEGPSATGRVAAGVGLAVAQSLPVVGPLASAVTAEEVSQAASRVGAALAERARTADSLPLSPAAALSGPFVDLLRRLAGDSPWLALFFDTYERTEVFLGKWLLDLVNGRYGDLPANLVLTVAGQRRLHPGTWAPYLDAIAYLPLQPFTDEEARLLLAAKGMTTEPVVEAILGMTGCLPVLVAMLAESRPTDITAVTDHAGDAVDRFLKWEPPERHAAALACALPRVVNQDVMDVLLGDPVSHELYPWLRTLPFVQDDAGQVRFHDVVRAAMLRLERSRSPQRWRQRHHDLAGAWRSWREGLRMDERDGWWDPNWQDCAVEETYHLLCAYPEGALASALCAAVRAAEVGTVMARRLADAIAQAGENSAAARLARLGGALAATVGDDARDCTDFLSMLLGDSRLDQSHRIAALAERAWLHQLANRLESCLADVDRMLQLQPDNADTLTRRGYVYRLMRRHHDALDDFHQVLAAEPDHVQALVFRGLTFETLGRDEAALQDFNHAVETADEHLGARVHRGRLLRRKGHLAQALADFDHAVEQHPESAWAMVERAACLYHADRAVEALDAIERALELEDNTAYVHANHGFVLCRLGRLTDGVAALNRALDAEPENVWALTWRGWATGRLGHADAALDDLNRAVAMAPNDSWPSAARGWLYWAAGKPAQALPDLERAVLLEPDYEWAQLGLALTLLWLQRPTEAHEALSRAAHEWSRHAPYARELADRLFDVLRRHYRRDDEVIRDAVHNAPVWIHQASRWHSIRQFALPLLRRSSLPLMRDSIRILRYVRAVMRDHPDTGPLESNQLTALADEVFDQLPQLDSGERG